MLSSPTRVTPLPVTVPRLTVQYSRKMLRSPISRRVGSPLYFLSCGASPSEANWKTRLSAPRLVGPLMTACGPIQQRGPITTLSPITANAPTSTSSASCALGEMTARGSMRAMAAPQAATNGDALSASGKSIISAEQASSSPTYATVESFQMPFMLRST